MTSSHRIDIWNDRGHVPGYQIRIGDTDRIVYERDDPDSYALAYAIVGLLEILESRERDRMRKEDGR